MQTSNPALQQDTFSRFGYGTSAADSMTMQGVVWKTAVLLLITIISAGWMWAQFAKSGGNAAALSPWMIGSALAGLAIAVVTVFKPAWAPTTAPLYALVEGLFVGGLSAVMEASFPGIVIKATMLTFGTLFVMLGAYQSGLIKATDKLKMGIVAATGGIALVYIVSMVLGMFGVNVPYIYGGGVIGIGFSLFVIVIAALNFILDFDFIEQGTRRGVPKYMEWYAGFAMMVTLIWLYVEFLRLLSKLNSRN